MISTKPSDRISMASLLITLGIIYGDIGTSPLYVLKAIAGDKAITEQLIFGAVSCIFWTLTLQTTVKYIFFTLRADNHGEGGIFSLYALVRRHSKKLVIPTILGATSLLADGIITPPISVTSAIEGLTLLAPDLPVVPIVIVILSGLFFFQRFGTNKVGSAFGPIMTVWFSMLLILGFIQILQFPSVLKALNPVYAYDLLAHYPHGFWLLGAVFLCTTGAEALYSDLGHCGRNNIRISWIFVKTSLMINYLGQGAWLMHSGIGRLNNANPFFEIMPSWFLLPGILIATMATIIASQALISGSFTLISEAMSMNYWPRVTVRQPTNLKGQIYIPSVNTIIWLGCILTVLYFRTSSEMEAAYGFFISVAMLMTTLLLGFYLIYRLKWNRIGVTAVLTVWGIIEISFFITNVVKIQDRWMFLFFELVLFAVMYVWYEARKINNRLIKFVDIGKYATLFPELRQDENIPKFSTHLIYLTKANKRNEIEEKIMNSIFSKKPKRADVYWFLHINRTDDPYTLNYEVTELIEETVIKVTINIGFRVQPRTEYYFKKIVSEMVTRQELNMHVLPDGSTKYNNEPDFRFVVIEKFLSAENEFAFRDGLILNAYFLLKKLGQRDEKAFGLDKCDVVTEYIPFIFQRVQINELKRKLPLFRSAE